MKTPENLIDVLSDESFACERIPGARNFCVYETAFVDKVSAAFPDRATPLTVYGWSTQTREAEEAAGRLSAAGYVQVTILEGGLEGWTARGGITEGTGTSARVVDGRYAIDPVASVMYWTGRNLLNFHSGELRLSGGEIAVAGNLLRGGKLQIAMDSMSCKDITDDAMNRLLIAHLRSEDFFAVERFPEAELVITRSEAIVEATPGRENLRVTAQLTLRGETHEVGFAVVAAVRDDGALVAQGAVAFDRTRWGSIYGSGRFFARLGKHVVNDLIDLQVKIVATPA